MLQPVGNQAWQKRNRGFVCLCLAFAGRGGGLDNLVRRRADKSVCSMAFIDSTGIESAGGQNTPRRVNGARRRSGEEAEAQVRKIITASRLEFAAPIIESPESPAS